MLLISWQVKMRIFYLLLFLWARTIYLEAQINSAPKVHSHNDYYQPIPFWTAMVAGAHSIEVDIFLRRGTLFVAHTEPEIISNRTLQTLYFQPMRSVIEFNLGNQDSLLVLIDIKSEPYATLMALLELIDQYPFIKESKFIRIVISGFRPKTEEFTKYPDYINFDYQSQKKHKQSGCSG